METKTVAKVRKATEGDLQTIAKIHSECFPEDCRNLTDRFTWVEANFKSSPVGTYYVAAVPEVIGYIFWRELGGFRPEAVLELEQIGIRRDYRRQGMGLLLTQESLKQYTAEFLKPNNRTIWKVRVTTAATNAAQELYRKALGAEVDATLHKFYKGDEVIMVAGKGSLERALGVKL